MASSRASNGAASENVRPLAGRIVQPVAQPVAQPVGWPVLIILLAVLAWSSVPLGSNRSWSMALLSALFLATAFAVSLVRMWRLSALPWPWLHADVRLPAVLLATWAGFSLLQSVPLPLVVIQVLSPGAYEVWHAAGVQEFASLSLDRGASLARGLHYASLVALFALGAAVLASRERLRVAAIAIVTMGALQALFGVIVALGRNQGWFVSGVVEGVGGISGTFVNPNHFAGFLEMCFCVSLGLGFGVRERSVSLAGARQFVASLVALLQSSRLVLLLAQGLMIAALFWSGSRGALLSLTVAIVITYLILLPVRADTNVGGRFGALCGIAVLALLVVFFAGPGAVVDKFANDDLSSNRTELVVATAAMGMDFALTGAGAGSFKSVFPVYKTSQLGLREYEHAHNDYLELFAEGGLIGLCLFVGAVVVCVRRSLRRARRRRALAVRAMSAGCLAACLSLLVHALFDFNFQIPANASLFVFILVMGLMSAVLPSEGPNEVPRKERS